MRKIIYELGDILLGAIIFLLIFGDTNSLKVETNRIFTEGITSLKSVKGMVDFSQHIIGMAHFAINHLF